MGGNSTTTQAVTIPPEVLARYNAVNNEAQGLMSTPFQTYGGEFVSPVNATQQGGINQISQNANAAQPYYGAATGVAGAALGAASPITGQQINQYMSPYLGDVVGSESALLNQNNQQAMAGQLGNAISSGAFGGDRAGIAAANLNQQQQLANANIYSNLLNTGYNTALQTAQQQQAQQVGAYQTGANQLAALGAGAQSAALQGGQAQIAAGQVQQQTQQAQDTALYNQFLQQQAYPFQQVQFAANIAEGTGALSGQTQTTNQPGAMLARGGRAGKAYGGGLSEGGNVLPQHAGEGFAVGGLAGYDPSAWASILSGQHPGAPVGGIGGTGLMAQATAGGGQHYTLPSLAAPKAQEPGALTKGLESGVTSAVDSKLKSMLEKPKPPAPPAATNAPTGVNPDVSAMSHEGEHAPDAGSNSDTQVAPAQGAEAPPADASDDVSSVADDSNAPDFSDMGENRGGRIGLAGGGVTGAEVNAAMPYGGGGNDALESLDTAGASNASLPTLAAAPKPSGGMLDSIMGDVAKIGIQAAMAGAKRGGAIKGYADGGTPGYGELGMISSLFSDPALRQIMLNAMKQKPASDNDSDLLKDPASDIGNEQEVPKSEDAGLAAAPTPTNSAPAPTGLVPAKAAEAKAPANLSKIASMIAASEGTGKNPIPGSSAMGKGQFVNKTFRSYAAKVDPELAQKIAGMSNSELTAYRQQHAAELADAQSKMYDTYTKENYDRLTKAGITPDAGSMYLAHAVPAVAPSILTADPNTPLRKYLKPDEISQNWRIFGGTKGRDVNEYTTGDAIRGTRARMAQFENKFAAGGLVGRKGYALDGTVDDGSDDAAGDATGLAPTDADLVPESKIEQGPGKRTLADALSAIDSSDLTKKASAPKVGLNAATPSPADDSAQNAAAGAAQGAASAVPVPAGLGAAPVTASKAQAPSAEATPQQDAFGQVSHPGNFGSVLQDVKHGSANAILPILAGLAGAATARTRNFGTALLAGLGQGAAAYQNQRQFAVQEDTAEREAQAKQLEARTGAFTAGMTAGQKRYVQLPDGTWKDLVNNRVLSDEEHNQALQSLQGISPYLGAIRGTLPAAPAQTAQVQPAAGATAVDTAHPKPLSVQDAVYQKIDQNSNVAPFKNAYEQHKATADSYFAQAQSPVMQGRPEQSNYIALGQQEQQRAQQALDAWTKNREYYGKTALEGMADVQKGQITTNIATRDAAYAQAVSAQDEIQNANAVKAILFDKNGRPNVNTGPLGDKIAKLGQIAQQVGISPDTIKTLSGTDPNDAALLDKLSAALAAEASKDSFGGSRITQSEYAQMLRSVPTSQMPSVAAGILVDKIIKPRAENLVNSYSAIAKGDLINGNFQNDLLEYKKKHPWASVPSIQAQTSTPQGPTADQHAGMIQINGKWFRKKG